VVDRAADGRDESLSSIQQLHREVNRRIAEVSRAFARHEPLEFLCECGSIGCETAVRLTSTQWNRIVRDDSLVLSPDHAAVAAAGRRRVAATDAFVVVERG
jgi:hypothetical protein